MGYISTFQPPSHSSTKINFRSRVVSFHTEVVISHGIGPVNFVSFVDDGDVVGHQELQCWPTPYNTLKSFSS